MSPISRLVEGSCMIFRRTNVKPAKVEHRKNKYVQSS